MHCSQFKKKMKITRNINSAIKILHVLISCNRHIAIAEKAHARKDLKSERAAIADAERDFVTKIENKFPIEFEIIGRENLPEDNGFVIISNHQGYADIPAIMKLMNGRQIGFIAKDTLSKIPKLGAWISRIRGVYITRGNAKSSINSIRTASTFVSEGFNMLIFPEGTRSKGPEPGEFKSGSFRLAFKAKAPIVPVTINDSYKFFEENGFISPAKVTVVAHPPVETADITRKDYSRVEGDVLSRIKSTLAKLNSTKQKT